MIKLVVAYPWASAMISGALTLAILTYTAVTHNVHEVSYMIVYLLSGAITGVLILNWYKYGRDK